MDYHSYKESATDEAIKVTYTDQVKPSWLLGMSYHKRFSFGRIDDGAVIGAYTVVKSTTFQPRGVVSEYFKHDMAKLYRGRQDQAKEFVDLLDHQYHRPSAAVGDIYDNVVKFNPKFDTPRAKVFRGDKLFEAAYRTSLKALDGLFQSRSVHHITREDILQNPFSVVDEPSASAGLPWATADGPHTKKFVLGDDEWKQNFVLLTHMMKRKHRVYRKYTCPCIAYQKVSVSTADKKKVRLIWGYPLPQTLVEAMFAKPLIELSKQLEPGGFPTSYTFGPYSGAYRYFLAHYVDADRNVYVRDFTSYDTSVPSFVIADVFDILKKHVLFKSRSYAQIFDNVVDYFVNTPILIPGVNSLFVKHHGIPSGSMFTSLLGSLCNYVMTLSASLHCGSTPLFMKCMGDDNLAVGGPHFCDVNVSLRRFGLTINDDKCYAGSPIGAKFLGRIFDFSSGYGWHRDPFQSLISLAFPSRSDRCETTYAVRTLMAYLDTPCGLTWKILQRHKKALPTGDLRKKLSNDDRRKLRMVFQDESMLRTTFSELPPAELESYLALKGL